MGEAFRNGLVKAMKKQPLSFCAHIVKRNFSQGNRTSWLGAPGPAGSGWMATLATLEWQPPQNPAKTNQRASVIYPKVI